MSESAEKQNLEQALLDELRKQDALKKEILAALTGSPTQKSKLQVFNHPAVLLLLGFIFTGLLGTAFTTYWQSKEWTRQQALLAQQRALDQKYELANEIAKAIGETHAAASNVIFPIQMIDDDEKCAQELPERVKAWQQSRRDWLVNCHTLLQRLAVHFRRNDPLKDNQACIIFDSIIDARKRTNVEISNLLEDLEKSNYQRTDTIKEKLRAIVTSLNGEQKDEARKLMEVLADEIIAGAASH